jgi:DNA mismatch repair protein MutS
MKEITSLPSVTQCHLTIDCQGDKIIYDRRLKPGSGKCLYGLEVAKHLKLPDEVLAQAYSIRDTYYNGETSTIVPRTSTGFNANKIINQCPICKNQAEHTHHIRYQCEADSRDYVTSSMHKNHPDYKGHDLFDEDEKDDSK